MSQVLLSERMLYTHHARSRGEVVMVLNTSSEPLHLIRLGRALHLLSDGGAEMVEQDGTLRAGGKSYPKPLIIRLRRYVHIPWREAPLTPRNVKLRDGGLCQWCRVRPGDTLDHVVPRSRHGKHVWSNIVLACRSCNNRKGDRLASELGWRLEHTPHGPSRRDLFLADPSVRQFLRTA